MRRPTIMTAVLLIGAVVSAQNTRAPTLTTIGPGRYERLITGTNPIRIPFTMLNAKPVLDLEINGKKATLMIDNGILWDQVWLFGSPLVDELGLKPQETASIEGAGAADPTQAYTSSPLTLKFPNIIFYDQPVLVSPPAAGFARMFPGADGQLCNTFFKHFIVEFDFVQNQILLHDPRQFRYDGAGSVLDMKVNESGTYSVPFSFTMLEGKTYTDRVDIDLGGIYPLKIALNNKHNIQLPSEVKELFSYGAQGKALEYSGKIQSMALGEYEFKNLTVVFGNEKTSRVHPGNLGVIGLPLFMKFRVIFDYFNSKLYIEPNKNSSVPFK